MPTLEIDADILATLGTQTKEMHHKMMRGEDKAIYKPLGYSFQVPAGATGGQFDIPGSPQRGRTWNILKTIICTTNPVTGLPDLHTVLPGVSVDLYAGTMADANTPPTADCGILTGNQTIFSPQGNSLQNTGSQLSPTAGTIITSVAAVPAGQYEVSWTTGLGGTTSATDANNFELFVGATGVLVSMNGTVSGSTYPQTTLNLTVPAGGATVSIQAIATATSGAVYRGQLVLTPIQNQLGNVPSITTWSRKVEWCAAGERVVAVVYGATAGQVINVIVRVAEYCTDDVEASKI